MKIHIDFRWCEQTVDQRILKNLLPGPFTLIFKRSTLLPKCFNPDHDTVGIRIPAHSFVLSLLNRLGSPLAQSSANISGATNSPICIEVFLAFTIFYSMNFYVKDVMNFEKLETDNFL